MSKLLLVTGDLMLLSRLERVAQACQLAKLVAPNAERAIADCDGSVSVAIVDLQTPGVEIGELVTGLKESNPQIVVVATGPHVHEQKLDQAKQAGCNVVVSRGQLVREAEAIVQSVLS